MPGAAGHLPRAAREVQSAARRDHRDRPRGGAAAGARGRLGPGHGHGLGPVARRADDDQLADFLAKKKAKVSDRARPAIDTGEAHRAYVLLLRAATSGRQTDEAFRQNLEIARGLSADDERYHARMIRGNTIPHRDWLTLNEARHQMRWKWAEFFKDYDLLLCPPAASAAFPHNQPGERWEQTIRVNGREVPCRLVAGAVLHVQRAPAHPDRAFSLSHHHTSLNTT